MRIERHNLDRKCGYLPWPVSPEIQKKYWPAWKIALMIPVEKDGKIVGYESTPRIDLLQGKHIRMDIVLINSDSRQYQVFPGRNGTLTGNVDKLDAEDLEWAQNESRLCWEAAQTDPLMMDAILYGWYKSAKPR